jgi:hypothetical protein
VRIPSLKGQGGVGCGRCEVFSRNGRDQEQLVAAFCRRRGMRARTLKRRFNSRERTDPVHQLLVIIVLLGRPGDPKGDATFMKVPGLHCKSLRVCDRNYDFG